MADERLTGVPPGAALDRIAALESRMRYTAHGVLSLNRGELGIVEWCKQVLEYADTLCAEVDTLRAALDARPPQAPQEWRPIETHDGTPMPVLIVEQGGYVVEAWFSDERQTWWELNSCDDGSPGSDRRVYPTHWQPLPHPPAADARRPGQEK